MTDILRNLSEQQRYLGGMLLGFIFVAGSFYAATEIPYRFLFEPTAEAYLGYAWAWMVATVSFLYIHPRVTEKLGELEEEVSE